MAFIRSFMVCDHTDERQTTRRDGNVCNSSKQRVYKKG